jgi:hypothetical protein
VGIQTLVLTAHPHAPFGSAFFDTNTNLHTVPTFPHDIDGDTTLEQVADTLTINCSNTPLHTSTGTPPHTPTPCPTDTGPLGGQCVPHTATISLETPPQPATQTPTPSATPFSEILPPVIISPSPTDFSEVSPALATPRGTVEPVGAPDAGGGPAGSSGDATLAALALLSMALFVIVATAFRRYGDR